MMGGRTVVTVLAVICVALGAADFFLHGHPYFSLEEIPAFYGLFGLAAAFALVLVAKVLSGVLRRGEDFYDE